MEKSSERETQDFMNVQSFSQLPFIRPPPLKEKPIKLFGIEFPNSTDVDDPNTTDHDHDDKESSAAAASAAADTGETNRRFECHYCCRNFPTSQALGGHQNAHKRERQHAKRAQLHSVMLHNTLPLDSSQHLYSVMNYHRLGSAHSAPPITYPTWHNTVTTSSSSSSNANAITTTTTTTGRFYGGSNSYPHHQLQPINGSPLALWRIPTVQSNPASLNRDRSMMQHHHPLPLFAADEINVRASQVVASASQNRFVYDSKPSVQDHVSLDLHL